ncbi:hypothetical protein [Nocardia asiatica]|uniref:hypothetical protein n=1 Tax=Nocardia asiatica TaxID=209252 RepID=UPI0012F8C0C4|nr:hypothetical protein [Nocardia asiatica]
MNACIVARKDLPLFSATKFTSPRRILVRAVVAGAIVAAPLTISAIPAAADSATSVAVATEIDHRGWDDRPGFHGSDRDKDWPGDHDRGRGNDPLWRLFHNLVPRGLFGSS